MTKHSFIPGQPVPTTSKFPVEILIGHKTALMTILWQPKKNDNPTPSTQFNNIICVINNTLQH